MGSSGCYIDQSIYITGGSGSYEYAIQGNGYGMSVYGDGELEGTLKSAGNYAITVGITDKDNASRKATARLSVSFAAGRTISGIVKDAKGNPLEDAEVDFTNRNRADRYLSSAYDYTDSKGAYSVTLVNGTYDIDASMTNASRHILSYKVTTSKSGVDIALPVYPVMVYSNNSAVSSFGSWYDSTGTYYGSGNKLYLKAGTYQLTSTFSRGLVDYTAKISLKVTAATTSVTAAVTGKSNLSVTGDISLGEAVTVTNASDYRYYRFVPTETKTYYFYSEGSVDSYGLLCNTNGEELASDDDSGTTGGNFLISYECTAGTAYYIRISSYGDESSFNLFVSDTNPASYEGE